MYKISVPIAVSDKLRRFDILSELHRLDAQRVFLAISILSFDKEKRKEVLQLLEDNIRFFKNEGFEIGVWLWTFWRSDFDKAPDGITKITGTDGKTGEFCCPTSVLFVEDTCDFLKQVAQLNPDIIMFDDDYRFGNLKTGFGCCCENHLNMMSDKLKEPVTRDNLFEKIFCGGANKYRDAWLESLGSSMENFGLSVRRAVNQINSNIRICNCTCMSQWDLDGTDGVRITKALAGDTKPMLRLIGAPYWAVKQSFGLRLQNCIEQERQLSSFCKAENFEIMAEGDVYPRPRHKCPASYLEGFDTAIRFSGCTDGILKYALSYTSSPLYETGYVDFHQKNKNIYEDIDRIIEGTQETGVRVYESMHKVRNADLPKDHFIGKDYMQNLFYSPILKMLADNTIATTYFGDDRVGAVFGENAKYLPEEAYDNGLIIDVKAARILMDKGIDIGLESVGECIDGAKLLYYRDCDEYVESYYSQNSVYKIIPKSNAKVLVTCKDAGTEYPDTVFYQNENGQKFLVFAFDAYLTEKDRYRSYAMQKLLCDFIDITKTPLDAKCNGHPDLYMMCRKSDYSLVIGLWNFFADVIDTPTITLSQKFMTAKFINTEGDLDGNTVTLSPLQPFSFAFIRLSK